MSIPAHTIQHLGRTPFFHRKSSSSLTLCFIPGFRSSFQASLKSDHLFHWTQQHNVGFLTWDHNEETSIQDWCQQGQDIITTQLLSPLTGQPRENDSNQQQQQQQQRVLFVGASLGAWLAIRIAHNLTNCIGLVKNESLIVHGLIGIGGTVDSTERWLQEVNDNTAVAQPQIILEDGIRIWRRPSKYAAQGYYDIPMSFLEASRPSLLFGPSNDIMEIHYPVHLIHGALDQDVPLSSVYDLLHWIRSRQSPSSTAATAHLHLIEDALAGDDGKTGDQCSVDEVYQKLHSPRNPTTYVSYSLLFLSMGLKYRVYLQQEHGKKIYGCLNCQSHLALDDMIVSKEFSKHGGPTYLFQKVVNIDENCNQEEKTMTTGTHIIATISCIRCNTSLGWKYVKANDVGQKHKEGKYTLDKMLLKVM